MKKISTVFVLLTLTNICIYAYLQHDGDDALFDDYRLKYKLTFESDADQARAKQTFLTNYWNIQDHNALFKQNLVEYKKDVNQFTYLDDDSLMRFLGHKEVVGMRGANDVSIAPPPGSGEGDALPYTWNWKEKGAVRDVQDQGYCESCYAYAAIGALEGAINITFGDNSKLSEVDALQCTNGCNGGDARLILQYTKRRNGTGYAVDDSGNDQIDHFTCNARRRRNPVAIASRWLDVPGEYNMKYSLVNKGPLYARFQVYKSFYSYVHGIYDIEAGEAPLNNAWHSVVVVGYGTRNGKNFWILKNSWGASWGRDIYPGYFRMARGSNTCRIESGASYPVLNSRQNY